MKIKKASELKNDDWIIESLFRIRVVDVRPVTEKEVKISYDHGNGGYPGTRFAEHDEEFCVE